MRNSILCQEIDMVVQGEFIKIITKSGEVMFDTTASDIDCREIGGTSQFGRWHPFDFDTRRIFNWAFDRRLSGSPGNCEKKKNNNKNSRLIKFNVKVPSKKTQSCGRLPTSNLTNHFDRIGRFRAKECITGSNGDCIAGVTLHFHGSLNWIE